MDRSEPVVVLVHGAFADASTYADVIGGMLDAGISCIAPPNPLRGLANDAAAVRDVLTAMESPIVLVGHSYGGAVITQAAVGLPNVKALVYLAGLALDEGESAASVQAPFGSTLLATAVRPSSYSATGAAAGPELYIDTDRFHATFCADVAPARSAVMAATQRPIAAATLGERCTGAAWKTTPSWYLVSTQDQAIHPDAQRFMAERVRARCGSIDGSHAAFVAQPAATTTFIKDVVAHVQMSA